jgi:MFS family permease
MSSAQTNIHSIHSRGRSGQRRLGLALVVICTAQLMLVLDETIVNTALPHVQRALAFSGNSLEWVVNAYALTFGGLLLLGGRAGDILGRRRIFITGIALFSTASLFGGLATAEWWLLAARAIQGTGAAIAAPAALALIATTFPQGQPRNRALGVYAAMTGAGGSIGLLAGGLLTTYASWRWVFFVNVPIGLMLAVAAPSVIPETPGHRGRFDLPGALTGTAGFSLLVYGLTRAATGPDGISHWTDTPTIAALAGAAVLLVSFTVIEWRSRHALLPLRLFASRDRSGTYVIIMCLGTAIFGMFFFLTIFMQTIWGYSALRAGAAYLPLSVGIILVAGVCSRLVSRIGRPSAAAGRNPAGGRRHVLALPHRRAPPLRLRHARPDAAGRGRPGHDLRAPHHHRGGRRPRARRRCRLQPVQRRPAGRRVDRPGHPWHRRLDHRQHHHQAPARPRRGRHAGTPTRGRTGNAHLRPRHLHRLLARARPGCRRRPARPAHHAHRDPGPTNRSQRRQPAERAVTGARHQATVDRYRRIP